MKRGLYLALAFCLCASFAAYAQSKSVDVKFSEESYDFGLIDEQGGQVTHDFEFVNNGTAPVVLKSVRASCGCTTPNWPKAPIAAGGSSKISVTYNPLGRPGVFSKSITVVVGGAENSQATYVLKIMGEVAKEKFPIKENGVGLDRQKISFKEVMKGEVKVDSIQVYNGTLNPMFVKFTGVPKHITVKLEPKNPVAGQRSNFLYPSQVGVVVVKYYSQKSQYWGDRTDEIKLVAGDGVASVPLTIFAHVKEDFSKLTQEEKMRAPIAQLSQTYIDLGKVKLGTGVTKSVELKNAGATDLKIRYIDPKCDFIKVTYDKGMLESGKSVELRIELLPYDLPKIHFQKRIEIVTNDPLLPKQVLTLSWDMVGQ